MIGIWSAVCLICSVSKFFKVQSRSLTFSKLLYSLTLIYWSLFSFESYILYTFMLIKKIKIAISLKTLIRIKCRSQQLSVLEKCKALSWFRFVCKLWTRCRLDLLTFRLLPRSNNNCYLYVGIDLWLVRVCLQEVESK